jgi:hypothetical protein
MLDFSSAPEPGTLGPKKGTRLFFIYGGIIGYIVGRERLGACQRTVLRQRQPEPLAKRTALCSRC